MHYREIKEKKTFLNNIKYVKSVSKYFKAKSHKVLDQQFNPGTSSKFSPYNKKNSISNSSR